MSAVATELIARAVIRSSNALFVARERGKSYVFLPGGHVEPAEPEEDALVRELNEELGVSTISANCSALSKTAMSMTPAPSATNST